MGARKWVFAVHRWETSDGYHNVSYGVGSKFQTKRFKQWRKAEAFAREQARTMKMKQFQVDTPRRPHVMVNVRKRINKKPLNIFR